MNEAAYFFMPYKIKAMRFMAFMASVCIWTDSFNTSFNIRQNVLKVFFLFLVKLIPTLWLLPVKQ